MDSIWLNYSIGIKIKESFLCLIVGCYTMVLCAECSIGRSYFSSFVQHFWIFLHCLELFVCLVPCCWIWICCLESRTSSMSCYTNKTFHSIEILHWKIRALFLSCFFLCLAQHKRGEKMLQASAVNESIVLPRTTSHCCLFWLRVQAWNFFSASGKYCESVSICVSWYFSLSPKFDLKKEVVIDLQHSQLSVLQDTEAYNDWFLKFYSRFCHLHLVTLVVDMSQSLEFFIVDRWMCPFNIHKPCN